VWIVSVTETGRREADRITIKACKMALLIAAADKSTRSLTLSVRSQVSVLAAIENAKIIPGKH